MAQAKLSGDGIHPQLVLVGIAAAAARAKLSFFPRVARGQIVPTRRRGLK